MLKRIVGTEVLEKAEKGNVYVVYIDDDYPIIANVSKLTLEIINQLKLKALEDKAWFLEVADEDEM